MEDLILKLKGLLMSKTFWVGIAVTAAGALAAPVQEWIAAHPSYAFGVPGLLMGIVMRWLTTNGLADKTKTS